MYCYGLAEIWTPDPPLSLLVPDTTFARLYYRKICTAVNDAHAPW